MKIAVLGAGVVGVTSAWYLSRAGHEIVVIERQAAAALETSFANGGQVSVSHAEPWASPRLPGQLLSWIGRESSPLLWRLRFDSQQWRWGLAFLAQCRKSRMQQNTDALLRLGLHSRKLLQQLRDELALDYDQQQRGILRIYTSEREMQYAAALEEVYVRHGCAREIKSPEACIAIEPALRDSQLPLQGGLFAPDDESGDACRFTQILARHCADRAVDFRFGESIRSLQTDGRRVTGVMLVSGETVAADAYVVALGSYSPLFLRPLGISLPVYPAKGYSLSIPLAAEDRAPLTSLTDDEHKLVISRLGNILRVAGTAEFNGYDTSINPVRCAAIARRVRQLFPHLSLLDRAEQWSGLRPATPGNVPLIGRTPLDNLYLNTGHGTLGWTLACGSAELLSAIVSQRDTALDSSPYRL